jgi:predicted metal-dependent hydrolase
MAPARKTASRRGLAKDRPASRVAPGDPPRQLALLEQGGTEVIRVRESTRARRMTIHVTPHLGVEVVVPRRTPAREVQRFVSKHLEWIEETEEELANTTPAFDRGLPLEILLPAIDQVWRVSYRRTPERKLRLCERPGCVLELSGPVQDEEACRVRLRQWLAEIARETLGPWLERISERTGLVYRTLQIRGQRTRWGSCSTQRTISLNYSLLFLARPLVRYLLVHELCHTRHINHGARFWGLVESLEPQAQTLDTELGDAWRDVPAWATWF